MSAPAGPTAAPASACDERCVGTCDGCYVSIGGGVHSHYSVRHAHRPNVCRNWRCDEWGPIHHGTPKHRKQPRMPGECAACDEAQSGRPTVSAAVAPVVLSEKERAELVCIYRALRALRDLLTLLGVKENP